MPEVSRLLDALDMLGQGLFQLISALVMILGEFWMPLAWVAFFLWCVRWSDLQAELEKGAWVPLLLLYLMAGWVWSLCSSATWTVAGSGVPNLVEKYLTLGAWVAIAFLCGSVQRSLNCGPAAFGYSGPPDAPAGGGHGHGAGHGHDDGHGHGAGHGHH